MGIVWEAHHKGVPCPWGSLKITLENGESREMEETMDTTRVGLYDSTIHGVMITLKNMAENKWVYSMVVSGSPKRW